MKIFPELLIIHECAAQHARKSRIIEFQIDDNFRWLLFKRTRIRQTIIQYRKLKATDKLN